MELYEAVGDGSFVEGNLGLHPLLPEAADNRAGDHHFGLWLLGEDAGGTSVRSTRAAATTSSSPSCTGRARTAGSPAGPVRAGLTADGVDRLARGYEAA